MHKFKIASGRGGKLRVQFLYNTEVMMWSETYSSPRAAKACIASVKKNAGRARVADLTRDESGKGYHFEIVGSKNRQFFLRFVAANGETMLRSEAYTDKRNARNCAKSVKAKAARAPVE